MQDLLHPVCNRKHHDNTGQHKPTMLTWHCAAPCLRADGRPAAHPASRQGCRHTHAPPGAASSSAHSAPAAWIPEAHPCRQQQPAPALPGDQHCMCYPLHGSLHKRSTVNSDNLEWIATEHKFITSCPNVHLRALAVHHGRAVAPTSIMQQTRMMHQNRLSEGLLRCIATSLSQPRSPLPCHHKQSTA